MQMDAMILFVFSALVCFPMVELRPGAAVYAVDGIEGILYEISEYEDPEVAILQLSDMGAMPVLTVLQMPCDEDHASEKEETKYFKKSSDVKTGLDDIISQLQTARSKLEKGNTEIYSDICQSIQNLKKLERYLHYEVHSNKLPVPLPVSLNSDEENTDSSDIKDALPSPTQAPTGTKIPDIQNFHHEDMIEAQFGDSIVITEKEKFEDGEKSIFHKKWTWKSSSKV